MAAASKGRYGCRGIKAAPGTGVSEKAIGRIMAGDGLVAHVPDVAGAVPTGGETTPAPGNLIARDFTAERPDEKRLTDITGTKTADGTAHPSPVIDRHDGKTVACTAGHGPDARPADTMPEKAAATLPEDAHLPAHSDRGRRHRRPGWLELLERFGPTGLTGAKGRSPDDAAAEGFLGGTKVESVHPERREEYTRGEVLALIDEYIHWHNHDRIKQSLGWMSPVQYRLRHGLTA